MGPFLSCPLLILLWMHKGLCLLTAGHVVLKMPTAACLGTTSRELFLQMLIRWAGPLCGCARRYSLPTLPVLPCCACWGGGFPEPTPWFPLGLHCPLLSHGSCTCSWLHCCCGDGGPWGGQAHLGQGWGDRTEGRLCAGPGAGGTRGSDKMSQPSMGDTAVTSYSSTALGCHQGS